MTTAPKVTLRVPFVSEQFNHQIRWTLAKHDIPARLVNPWGRTIRDLTRLLDALPDKICTCTCHSKSCPAPGICQLSNGVYVVTCIFCGEFYVGMMTRKLHKRAGEHMLSASKRNNNTALGDHYRERHNAKEQPTKKSSRNDSDKIKFKESPKINLKTMKHQPDPLRLHIEEAIAIKQLKLTLECGQETPGTGFLPQFFFTLPYFLSIHLYFFIILTFTCTSSLSFTCISSLSLYSPARFPLPFYSPVLPHCPDIHWHSSHCS